jgi:hypothetical protein
MKDKSDVYEDMPTMNGRIYPKDLFKDLEALNFIDVPEKQCDCVCDCKRMAEIGQKLCTVCQGLQKTTIKERLKNIAIVLWRYV